MFCKIKNRDLFINHVTWPYLKLIKISKFKKYVHEKNQNVVFPSIVKSKEKNPSYKIKVVKKTPQNHKNPNLRQKNIKN